MAKRLAIRDRILRLDRIRAGDLKPHPGNWRRHPQAQREALKGVLQEIGYADALLARETPDGLQLIDGHLRAELDPNQVVPVLVLDIDEVEARKLLVTLDPIGSMAQPDQDALLALLQQTEFQSQAVKDMLEALANGETQPLLPLHDPGAEIDRAEELRIKWGVERGQMWAIGRHRLMCGDAIRDLGMLTLGSKIDVVWTDPPYGIDYSGGRTQVVARKGHGTIQGDAEHDNGKFVDLALRIDASDWWICASPVNLVPAVLAFQVHRPIDAVVVWNKKRPGLGYQFIRRQCEFIMFSSTRTKAKDEPSETDLWDISTDSTKDYLHGTQKPSALMYRSLAFSGGDSVCDPFLGAGATMVAAEQLGRICYGMEIEPQYVAVTLERMKNMGLEPKLAKRQEGKHGD